MLAAALAYYTAFSLAPIIVVVVAVIGFVLNQNTVETQIIEQINSTMGADAANIVRDLIDNMSDPGQGIISSILGIGALLVGALGVFNNLQIALDRIWGVYDVKLDQGIKGFVVDKLLSFGMILVIGFLLLVSLVLSAGLSFLGTYFLDLLPGTAVLLRLISELLALGVTTILFMSIFKFLPHAEIKWRDVWVGSTVTALLFAVGRFVLGLYLGGGAIASSYGAAGAFVVILLWVYYSAQIVLFGAEFTQVFARHYGSDIVANSYVEPQEESIAGEPAQ